jgi:type VI secretion system protein ImpD
VPTPTTQQASNPDGDELETLLSRPAYITDLDASLRELYTGKAFAYWLSEYIGAGRLRSRDDVIDAVQRWIGEIDQRINEQLNRIIHLDRFQRLEASWRGLWFLCTQAGSTKNIKIRFLDINWTEVTKDIGRAMEFDQSQLFHKIYSEEYGTPGGEPYGVLIGDYQVTHRPSERHPHDDIETLEGIAEIAAAAFSPFITSASSEFFGLDDFSSLGTPLNLQAIFAQNEYLKWRGLRDKADSRFIGLTMPRILMRRPYRKNPGSYRGIYFYEQLTHSEDYLWGNACYGFAGILIREFANVGWFGHIRGIPRNQIGGGILTNLPADSFETDAEDLIHKPVTDVVITDMLERELSELGFIPLCQCYDTPFAAFYSNQTVQRPKHYDTKEGRVNAKLSAMMQHVLCGARIAHYIKVMIRDKVGSFINADECEEYLRRWLFKYTTGREDLEWEEQARYPLREAAVQVQEHPAKPGHYACIIHLRPHYQLDQMVSELELATELVQAV